MLRELYYKVWYSQIVHKKIQNGALSMLFFIITSLHTLDCFYSLTNCWTDSSQFFGFQVKISGLEELFANFIIIWISHKRSWWRGNVFLVTASLHHSSLSRSRSYIIDLVANSNSSKLYSLSFSLSVRIIFWLQSCVDQTKRY